MLRPFICTAVAAFALSAAAQKSDCAPNLIGHNVCEDIEGIAAELSRSLPLKVAENLDMVQATADGVRLRITYRLSSDAITQLRNTENAAYITAWKRQAFASVCQTDPTSALLGLGGEIDLVYQAPDQGRVLNFTLSTLQCAVEGFPVDAEAQEMDEGEPMPPAPPPVDKFSGPGWVKDVPNPTYERYRSTFSTGMETSPEIVSHRVKPSMLKVWGAAFRLENVIGSALAKEQFEHGEFDPDFWSLDLDYLGDEYIMHAERFIDVRTREHGDAVKRQIDREADDKDLIARSGWGGIVARGVAILLDWRGLLALLLAWMTYNLIRESRAAKTP